ncbi:MAG: F0F1 ATP synthase subunit B [Clostridia bacterium]|nr:F0F1 ATP synthase subunit B [Clostridia bacterium]
MKNIIRSALTVLLTLAVILGLSSCGKIESPEVTVSEDGYWVINGDKTTHVAQGAGSTSPKLTVDGNGYWEIDGVRTEMRAVEYEEFVSFNPWTVLFAWINLLILYLFLKKLLWKPVKKMIDDRQNEIDGMYADAEGKQKSAESMEAEYKEKLEKANEESEEIIRNAQRKAQLKEEEILKEADETARRTLKRAEEQVELEKKQALNEVKDEVSEMALEIASAVIGRDVKPDEHSAMIDDFIDRFDAGSH